MNQTPNYQLNLWEGEDRILREDFNADNAKIEAALTETMALAQEAPFAIGVLDYDGSKNVTVNLGKQPKMVIVGNRLGLTNIITTNGSSSSCAHAVAMPGYPGYLSTLSSNAGTTEILKVTSTGFTLYSGMKDTLAPYYYLALF